jgi:hypothetical protein
MAIKIELINQALVMHDTVTLETIAETPKRLVYYDVSELEKNSVIKIVNIAPQEQVHQNWPSQPIGANVVDGTNAAYTIATWKTFARTNLGF